MARLLKIEQRHIDLGEELRSGSRYVLDTQCPLMLAAREQVDRTWHGAHSFLYEYATVEGRGTGYNFIQKFDRRQDVKPIEIVLKEVEND